MKCRRCSGIMVEEEVFTREGGLSMMRCIYCGEAIDQLVATNRDGDNPDFAIPHQRARK
jgi:uncharacterized Zn finger protein